MSALPKAIQDQVDQAEALQQQLYPEDAPTEPVEPPAEPVEAEEPPSNVVELTKPQTPPEAPPAREDTVDYWKSRFETLRGKFDAEVPALHHQLKEQAAQLKQLAENQQKKPDAADEPLVTDKDRDEFGSDYVDFVEKLSTRVAQSAVAQAVAELRKEFGVVQDRVGQVAERVVMSESEKFWSGVLTLVPEWKQIDADQRWFDWLDTSPDFSEETYREIAGKAIAKGNAQKIAALVKKWKEELGLSTPAPAAEPKPDLSSQVAPSTSRASAPPPPGQKIWSKAEYESAYDPRNVSRYGVQKAGELIAAADQAVADGRVRW